MIESKLNENSRRHKTLNKEISGVIAMAPLPTMEVVDLLVEVTKEINEFWKEVSVVSHVNLPNIIESIIFLGSLNGLHPSLS